MAGLNGPGIIGKGYDLFMGWDSPYPTTFKKLGATALLLVTLSD